DDAPVLGRYKDGDGMMKDIKFLPLDMFRAGISGGSAVRPHRAAAAPTTRTHFAYVGQASSLSMSSRRAIRFLASVTLAVAVMPSLALAQDKATNIDALMSRYHARGQFNGTVLVAEKGNVILKKGYGMADIEWDIPNAPDTKFRLGSITKQFTSMLIMQLVQEGKIKLDGKLSDYLPYYRKDIGQ